MAISSAHVKQSTKPSNVGWTIRVLRICFEPALFSLVARLSYVGEMRFLLERSLISGVGDSSPWSVRTIEILVDP